MGPEPTIGGDWSCENFSGVAGASGDDVIVDSAYEVTFADEDALRIYDGPTVEIVYESREHSSVTLSEYPTIADVDRDGSAEIVVVTSGLSGATVTVFGHAGDGWAEAGPVKPNHDFWVTNLNPDLSIPSPAPLSWTMHNVCRARPQPATPPMPKRPRARCSHRAERTAATARSLARRASAPGGPCAAAPRTARPPTRNATHMRRPPHDRQNPRV